MWTILQVIQARKRSRIGRNRRLPLCKPSCIDRPGHCISTVPEIHKEEQAAFPSGGRWAVLFLDTKPESRQVSGSSCQCTGNSRVLCTPWDKSVHFLVFPSLPGGQLRVTVVHFHSRMWALEKEKTTCWKERKSLYGCFGEGDRLTDCSVFWLRLPQCSCSNLHSHINYVHHCDQSARQKQLAEGRFI